MTSSMRIKTEETVDRAADLENDKYRYLTFTLGSDIFAINIQRIQEVIPFAEMTLVPLAPAAIRGVINLRGSVVPVIDLAVRFGWPPTEIVRRTCVVVLEIHHDYEHTIMGVIVDQVREVVEIPLQDVEPPPVFGCHVLPELLLGIGKVRGQFILQLDVDRVLAMGELSMHPRVHVSSSQAEV